MTDKEILKEIEDARFITPGQSKAALEAVIGYKEIFDTVCIPMVNEECKKQIKKYEHDAFSIFMFGIMGTDMFEDLTIVNPIEASPIGVKYLEKISKLLAPKPTQAFIERNRSLSLLLFQSAVYIKRGAERMSRMSQS